MANNTGPRFLIWVDTREVHSGLTRQLQVNGVLDVQLAELPVGHFLISKDVVVERQTAIDFVASLLAQRLFGQIAHMKASHARPILILEGDVFASRSVLTPEALRAALSWISVIEGVCIVNTKDTMDSARYLETMTRHAQEGLLYDIALRGNKPGDLDRLAAFAVEGLPGCGPTTAKRLLSHFGSAGKVFAASADELCQVAGMGRNSAEQIQALLSHRYSGN